MGHFIGGTKTPDRNRCHDFFGLRQLWGIAIQKQIGCNRARCNRVDRNALGGGLERPGACHTDQARLGTAVYRAAIFA